MPAHLQGKTPNQAAVGAGPGAAIGAGAGFAAGGLAGTGAAAHAASTTQERYDIGFIQCLYGAGHRVPVYGRFMQETRQ